MGDRMLMSRQEAARAVSMSLSHFQRHAQPGLPCVRSDQLRLYRRTDLERWVGDEIGADTVRSRAGDHDLAEEHRRFIADCETGIALNKLGRSYERNAIVNLDSSLRRLPGETCRKPLDAVGSGELQEVVDGFRREGLSGSRIGSVINAVRSLYRWAIDRERALAKVANSNLVGRICDLPFRRGSGPPSHLRAARPSCRAPCHRRTPSQRSGADRCRASKSAWILLWRRTPSSQP
jgi:hypothetical protein